MDLYKIYVDKYNSGKTKLNYTAWLEAHLEEAILILRELQPQISDKAAEETNKFLKEVR